MHRVKMLVMLAGAATMLAGAAQAQIAPKSNAPIDIAADQSEAFTSECRVVWSGDVEALQAKTRLRASRLSVFSVRKGDGCGATQKLVADGEVFYVTAERIVRADNAVYLATGETITLTGNVVVVQGRNVARADRVVIDLQAGQSQMISNQKGRANPRRVRGVFYPGAQAN
jgi:lipopolysaccharide export system protein LptA